jgi:serine protease Do
MSRRFTIVSLVLSSVVAFLVGLILAGQFTPSPIVSSAVNPPALDRVRPAGMRPMPGLVSFADVAERINASVVNIDATANAPSVRTSRRQSSDDAGDDGPGSRDPDQPRQGSGSGFIIDPDGLILTNNHVIEDAQRITVTLADGRTFRGDVVGADSAIDVALLRLDGASRLPAAPLGDSDDLRVGEWVCAIGNPLGYVHSVTVGVVSFIGRKLFDQSLDNYIQTDAAINLGNSGGPLINARGEVIGINSAISSKASNIGFAVPINQAVAIIPQLREHGRVARGFIGVTLTDVTPELQRALGLTVASGAMVQDVAQDTPAERAGLRAYDVIVDVEGTDVETNDALIRNIAARAPGTVARLGVLRDGRPHTIPVKLAERPRRGEEFSGALPDVGPDPGAEVRTTPPLGITVRELDRRFLGRGDVPASIQGVAVRSVDGAGVSYHALRRGLIITELNRKPVASVAAYNRLVASFKPGDIVAIYYFDPASGQRTLTTVTVE